MAKSLLDKLLDSVFDEEWIGRRGEKLTERELKLVQLFGRKGRTLRNLYVPKDNGETSEIDLVYITQKGIFVFESKNYSGWIFGDEASQYWTVSLPNGQKNRFYNPIKQNRTHLKWLGAFVGAEIPLFSIVVFSERCELKKVTVESEDIFVIQRDRTYATVRKIWDSRPDVLSGDEVEALAQKLAPLTNADEALKAAHVEQIERKFKEPREKSNAAARSAGESSAAPGEQSLPDTEDGDAPLCPRCGKPLVLRTSKKGEHAGERFYGCSGFPKCRYMQKL